MLSASRETKPEATHIGSSYGSGLLLNAAVVSRAVSGEATLQVEEAGQNSWP